MGRHIILLGNFVQRAIDKNLHEQNRELKHKEGIMDNTISSTCVMLHFGAWETRKIFHVSMCHVPKKGDLLGLIIVGFQTRGICALQQVCRVRSVVHRNINGDFHVTASIKSETNMPFAHIDAENCYVIFV